MQNKNLKLKIFFLAILFCGIFGLAKNSQATTYNWYFSQSGDDGTGDGSMGNPWKSLDKVETQITSMVAGVDTAYVYLKRGDTWVFDSNDNSPGHNNLILIKRSNVTIDAYGTGAKPKLDGNSIYPQGIIYGDVNIPYSYAIMVGEGAGGTVSNVYIKNLQIYNMYPGGGIIFTGKNSEGNYARGPGSVEYCDFYNIGWGAIYIYGVPNSSGPSGAIKIEHNSVSKGNEYPRLNTYSFAWPNAIGGIGGSNNHECRYNTVTDIYGEGIGSIFSIIEYNMVSDTHSSPIYLDGYTGQVDVRYNLLWGKIGGVSPNSAGIGIDDESAACGPSTDIRIYGNVILGGNYGIILKNNPWPDGPDYTGWSSIGSVKVYNNTIVDCQKNIVAAYSNRFSHVEVKNNASIINTDSASVCQHIDHWTASEEAESWVNWTFGPNFYYGDGATSNSSLETPFQNANNVFGTSAPLPKTSDWRALTSLSSFSFTDLYPSETSQLINRTETEQIVSYDQYLTTGTNWETLPNNEDFVLTDQDSQGADWDFGAIINQQSGGDVTPPTAPSGLSVE